MKKNIFLLLSLILMLALTGCNGSQSGAVSNSGTQTEETQTEGTQADETESEVSGDTVTNIEMVSVGLDTAIEKFYEDENYEYYLPEVKSQYITVLYKDGTTENVKEALVKGNITFDNLKHLGVDFSVKEKEDTAQPSEKHLVTIIDWVEVNDLFTADAEELFYEDENYWYSFSSIRSSSIEAYYSDGTKENVKDALEAGRITIEDLERNEIHFWKEKK